ncbi:DUF2339 domain-containing protein [Mucisphaera calidilacus]|uniref:DUF2339 domain-containing protein n=1 Tax=Mucisphaera calidilacus TaxID=2527982 RepID=A0A518BUR8_9BACT|nr:DUF2339 domain-containing protein [Mucisphaera calidilacus]QDU70733.1 hypothetical protein Pan265_05680 [Mucisphaera calidilacus]
MPVEALIVVVVLITVISVPLCVIYLLIANASARRRLDELEHELRLVRARMNQALPPPTPPTPESISSQPVAETSPSRTERLHEVLAERRAQATAESQSVAETPISPPESQTAEGSPPEAAETTSPIADDLDESVIVTSDESEDDDTPGERPSPESLEDVLGSRIFVWIGGIAIALGGAFLVKYSWDNDLLSAQVRLSIGALIALMCTGVGYWMKPRAERVAAALVGAGIAIAYGVTFAATSVYHFLGPTSGFILMGLITAAAVMLSLRHGMYVAMLALLGGFVTPVLVGDSDGSMAGLFAYLIVLQTGLVVVTRRRGWIGISGLTLVGSIVWSVVMALTGLGGPDGTFWGGLLLVASCVVYVLHAARAEASTQQQSLLTPLRLAMGAIGASAALLGILLASSGYDPSTLIMLAVLSAGSLALAHFDARYRAIPWLTLVIAWLMLLGVNHDLDADSLRRIALLFGGLFSSGACLSLLLGRHRRELILMSCVGLMLFVALVALIRPVEEQAPLLLWWVMTIIAGAYALLAWVMRGRYREAAGGLALTVVAWLTWAASRGIELPWTVLAWSLLAVAACMLAPRLRMMRYLRWSLAWLLPLIGSFLLVAITRQSWATPGTTSMIYYVPSLLIGLAALQMHRRRQMFARDVLSVMAVLLSLIGSLRLVHQVFHGKMTEQPPEGLTEWGCYVLLLLVYPTAMLLIDRWRSLTSTLTQLAKILSGLAAATTLAALALFANPIILDVDLAGGIIFNEATLFYGLAAALLLWLSQERIMRTEAGAIWLGIIGLSLIGWLGVVLIRDGFAGENSLVWTPLSASEWTTHTLWFIALAFIAQRQRFADHIPALNRMLPVYLLIGLAAGAGCLSFGNPLWLDQANGSWPVLNAVLYAYGTPVVAFAFATRYFNSITRPVPFGPTFAVSSLVMLFVLVTLQVRHAFTGGAMLIENDLINRTEWYAYSVAWLALGAALLTTGLLVHSRALRFGSLIVVLLAVGKVFLLDTTQLDGLYRVASFFGLGLSLLAVGYVYQRFVFGRPVSS